MGSYKAALPGMFAEDLASDRHNVEALSRPSSSGNIFTPSFCRMTVSSLSTLQQVSCRRCGSSSHTPVDRAGGVERNSLYLGFSGHMEISSFAHARYKYPTCKQEKCKLLCNLCML